ncbi:hypothetical protein ACFV5G_38525 [Streptomyces sp. NPDC059766]|uniref:hypothetical protein n=1 Tax=Streptomyces sp. NPDC059766 TaxID=3346940 RepID=UPI00365B6970
MTGQTPGDRPNMRFPHPLGNGLDYLSSVVDHLGGEPKPSDLKYAVLHLQAATEVLLKARLLQEHWSLVFKEPGRADRSRFESGDFESCSTADAINRLRGIVGVQVTDTDAKEINQLAKWRNALQHYGLTAPAPAVEARAAKVLDILLQFVTDHLLPALNDEGREYADDAIYSLRSGLTGVHAFVRKRMDRIRPALVPEQTVACPECSQLALTVGTDPLRCCFCEEDWSSSGLAVQYVRVILGQDIDPDYLELSTWGSPVRDCPTCREPTSLVLESRTAAAPDRPTALCFGCGGSFTGLVDCEAGCGGVVRPDLGSDHEMCPDCFSHATGRS